MLGVKGNVRRKKKFEKARNIYSINEVRQVRKSGVPSGPPPPAPSVSPHNSLSCGRKKCLEIKKFSTPDFAVNLSQSPVSIYQSGFKILPRQHQFLTNLFQYKNVQNNKIQNVYNAKCFSVTLKLFHDNVEIPCRILFSLRFNLVSG